MTVEAAKLVRMAEQVAANLDFDNDPQALAQRVASHLDRFWDPRMKAAIRAYLEEDGVKIDATVRTAVELMPT